MAIVPEDFSFPKLTTTSNNSVSVSQFSISNPSIWLVSSLVHPDQGNEEKAEDEVEEEKRDVMSSRKHKSFSEYEAGETEARMDLLWQDFNERELQRSNSLKYCRIANKARPLSATSDVTFPPDRIPDACFWPRQDSSSRRASSLVRRPRRPSTVVLLRALRRLFFVHTLARDKKSL